MIDVDELRSMSQEERRKLTHALASLDESHILTDATFRRRRHIALLVFMGCCVILAGWIVAEAFTLPRHYTSAHWREAWVGFDIALLAAFACTAWAAWYERQVLILCLTATGTLLCCDAWFDIMLDLGSRELPLSIASAGVAELPLACGMFIAAWRLMRMSVYVVMNLEGLRRPVPALWRVPLFAEGLQAALPARYRERDRCPPGDPAARR